MKKITRIFALALAFVMAFALQAPVNAAEKAAVNQEKAQVNTQAAKIIAQLHLLVKTVLESVLIILIQIMLKYRYGIIKEK